MWLKPSGIACFAGDLSDEEQKLVWATQGLPARTSSTRNLKEPRGDQSRAGDIVGKNDRTDHPDLERFVAKRMGATTYEVDSSHVPMLSKPDVVLDVIRAAASAVEKSRAA